MTTKTIGRIKIDSDIFKQLPIKYKLKVYWGGYFPIWRFSLQKWEPTLDGWDWFNIGSPCLLLNRLYIRAWNLFNRVSTDGHFWGFGILQLDRRHLFYIGYNSVSIFFIGKSK